VKLKSAKNPGFDFLISQSAMPFFPGREHIYSKHTKMTKHIYNKTITTQACRENITHTNQIQKFTHKQK